MALLSHYGFQLLIPAEPIASSDAPSAVPQSWWDLCAINGNALSQKSSNFRWSPLGTWFWSVFQIKSLFFFLNFWTHWYLLICLHQSILWPPFYLVEHHFPKSFRKHNDITNSSIVMVSCNIVICQSLASVHVSADRLTDIPTDAYLKWPTPAPTHTLHKVNKCINSISGGLSDWAGKFFL